MTINKNLSKLQLRAEILSSITRALTNINDVEKLASALGVIEDKKTLNELLVKELSRSTSHEKTDVILKFLQRVGKVDYLKEPLWNLIKSPKVKDEIKNISAGLLRYFDETVDIDELFNYMQSPEEIADIETERFLKMAAMNPEAKIDFIDFLYTLAEKDQLNFLSSLKQDIQGEELAFMLAAILESGMSDEVEKFLIKSLGETQSPIVVKVLKDVFSYSKNFEMKQLAKKALSELKLGGVDIEKDYNFIPDFCHEMKLHRCFSSMIDGNGSQGIIVSRIDTDNDITMVSVVINDKDGVVDCFGFMKMDENDFNNIVNRFNSYSSLPLEVSPEYAKTVLTQAETINRQEQLYTPYEYICWRRLLADVGVVSFKEISEKMQEFQKNIEFSVKSFLEKNQETMTEASLPQSKECILDFPSFEHWFLDGELFDNKVPELLKEPFFVAGLNSFAKEQIEAMDENLYKKRLLNTGYLLKEASQLALADVALDNAENSFELFKNKLIKHSIREAFFRYHQKISIAVNYLRELEKWVEG